MTEADRAYWSAIAQVLPVLGLALVIETRTLIQSWQKHGGIARRDRRFQIWVLAAAGVGVVFGTTTSLSALEADEGPSKAMTWLVPLSLSLAVAGTLLIPILQVLMLSESKFIHRVFEWSLTERGQKREVKRQLSRMQRKIVAARTRAFRSARRAEGMLAEATYVLDRAQNFAGSDESIQQMRQKAQGAFEEARPLAEEARRTWRDMIVQEQNLRLYSQEVLRRQSEWSKEDREHLSRAVEATMDSADPMAGFTIPLSLTVYREAPDDGGFLSADPTPRLMPEYDPNEDSRFLTDPSAFYDRP